MFCECLFKFVSDKPRMSILKLIIVSSNCCCLSKQLIDLVLCVATLIVEEVSSSIRVYCEGKTLLEDWSSLEDCLGFLLSWVSLLLFHLWLKLILLLLFCLFLLVSVSLGLKDSFNLNFLLFVSFILMQGRRRG